MNQTPRGLNRVLIAIFGLLLLAVGAFSLALALWQPFVDWWTTWAPAQFRALIDFTSNATFFWLWPAVTVALVIVLVVAITWLASQGRGRTTLLLQEREDPNDPEQVPGTVSINGSVAEQLLRQALTEREELVAVSVTTYAIKGVPALRIRAYPRHGVSPLVVIDAVIEAVHALDAVLGESTPVLLNIGSAARARFVHAERVK